MEYRYNLDSTVISKRIKSARRNAELTQAELAEIIGISTNAVAKLENNLMNASLQTLVSIANALRLDINYFLLEHGKYKDETHIDVFLHSLIQQLSQKDKEFVIHTINGLKIYRTDGD